MTDLFFAQWACLTSRISSRGKNCREKSAGGVRNAQKSLKFACRTPIFYRRPPICSLYIFFKQNCSHRPFMEQLEVPRWKIPFFILSVTVNQSVMDFEWGALTGIGREEQVHLIWIIIGLSYVPTGVLLIVSINLGWKKLTFERTRVI